MKNLEFRGVHGLRAPSSLNLLVAVTLGLGMTMPVSAQLISYEGFNYPANSQLVGTPAGTGDGGTGWATPWSATSAAIGTNNGTGLTYGSLAVSGGGGVMG